MGVRLKNKLHEGQALEVLRLYETHYQANKAASNALNKQKTQAKRIIQEIITENQLPADTVFRVDGIDYKYDIATSEKLDPRKWYQMWIDQEITDDQYFDALDVRKEDAKQAIGDDQVISITIVRPGKDMDVRRNEKNQDGTEGIDIVVPEVKPVAKAKGIVPRLQATTSQPAVRKLKLPVKVGNHVKR